MNNRVFKIFDRGLTWADFLWRLIAFSVVFFGGTVAGIAAKFSEAFINSSPIIWFLIGLFTSLMLVLILYLFKLSKKQSEETKYYKKLSLIPKNINPIDHNFEDNIIKLSDLYLPLNQPHKHKTFKNCKITGPGVILLLGGSFNNTNFLHCGDIIAIPENVYLSGVIVLANCTLNNCEFINLTVIVLESKNTIDNLIKMGARVLVVNEIKK